LNSIYKKNEFSKTDKWGNVLKKDNIRKPNNKKKEIEKDKLDNLLDELFDSFKFKDV